MNPRYRLTGALAATLVLASFPASAEVSAEIDSSGAYVRTFVQGTSSAKKVRIWSKVNSRPSVVALNVDGDLNGDLWPAVAEQYQGTRQAWVIWSRFTGAGFDLAWSRFNPPTRSWAPIAWVEPSATPGDDLDPSIAFDSSGRPFLVWWRDHAGTGEVWLSLFLESKWMPPFRVSDSGIDSVTPTITLLSDTRVRIDYTTAAGTVTRTIEFNRPATITDDATPFGRFEVTSTTISAK